MAPTRRQGCRQGEDQVHGPERRRPGAALGGNQNAVALRWFLDLQRSAGRVRLESCSGAAKSRHSSANCRPVASPRLLTPSPSNRRGRETSLSFASRKQPRPAAKKPPHGRATWRRVPSPGLLTKTQSNRRGGKPIFSSAKKKRRSR